MALKMVKLKNADAASSETFSPPQMMKSKERIYLSVNTQGYFYKPMEEYGQIIVCLHLIFKLSVWYVMLCCVRVQWE